MDYELTEEADVDQLQATIRRGIRGADPPGIGPRDWEPLGFAVRAPGGDLLGGLYGATMWGWLMVDGLWVAEGLRGQGLGRRLVLAAETAAIKRGCRGAWLGTFDFQARGFYERLGFAVFAELADFPVGHSHYHMWKSLGSAESASRGSMRDGA